MKRLVTTVTTTLLLALLPLLPASAAVKAGATCAKLNATSTVAGYKYICIKSGKKLVWKKSVKVAVATPTPTPTEFKIPEHSGRKLCETFPVTSVFKEVPKTSQTNNATYSSLWEKYQVTKPTSHNIIMTSTRTSFAKNYVDIGKKVPLIDFYIDPELETNINIATEINAINKVFQTESLLMQKELEKPVSVVIFTNWTWLERVHIEGGCSLDSAAQRSSKSMNFASGWANPDVFTVYLNYSGSLISNLENVHDGNLAAHEIFHLVQAQNFSQFGGWAPVTYPTWFIEGGANLYSLMAFGDYSWIVGHENALAIQGDSKSSLENLPRGSARNYSLGPIACEFLIYLTGFKNYMNIWPEMGKGKVFSSAFQDATGIELIDFYTMFEEIRPDIGIPIL